MLILPPHSGTNSIYLGNVGQNVICRLRDPVTVDFLVQEFGVESQE